MIEVPPPSTFDGRTLRYGAMTCREYIWFRSKWVFGVVAWFLLLTVWEFWIGTTISITLGVVLLITSAVNLGMAFQSRKSWRYWNSRLDSWLTRQEHEWVT